LDYDSHTVNDLGKPDAGNPPVRFDEGRELTPRAYSTGYKSVEDHLIGSAKLIHTRENFRTEKALASQNTVGLCDPPFVRAVA
jgi:hypothetical protein